jgi:NAD-dependent SIR2 family protein deacetylase
LIFGTRRRRIALTEIIEINPDPTPLTEQAAISIRGKAGEILPMIDAALG